MPPTGQPLVVTKTLDQVLHLINGKIGQDWVEHAAMFWPDQDVQNQELKELQAWRSEANDFVKTVLAVSGLHASSDPRPSYAFIRSDYDGFVASLEALEEGCYRPLSATSRYRRYWLPRAIPYLLSDKEPHEEMLAIDSLTTINVTVRLNRIKVLVPQLSQFSSPGEPRSLHNCEQDLNNYLRTPDASGLIAKVDCINRRVLAHWPTLSLQDQESLIEEVQGLVRECQNRVQGVQVGDGPSITARRGHYLDTQLLARSLAGYRPHDEDYRNVLGKIMAKNILSKSSKSRRMPQTSNSLGRPAAHSRFVPVRRDI
ncbi:hypothetical protein JCM16303_000430 [Sporobolomyces ruberrimus]